METRKLQSLYFILMGLGVGLITLIFAGRSLADYQIFLPIIIKSPYEPEKGISLAYPNCEDLTTLNAGWYLNFSYTPSAGCPTPDQRFVPTIYGKNEANNSAILAAAVENAKVSGWLIGYGEPNLRGTSPLEGALGWRKIEEAVKNTGIKLVSPFPSPHKPNSNLVSPREPYGYTWTWEMVTQYQNLYGEKPHFDALGWNYYLINEPSYPPSPQNAINFFNARRQEALAPALGYDVPFWVLEYAGACWHSGTPYPTFNTETMQQVTAWYKNTAWVTRYAWFSNRIRGTEPWGLNHQSCSLVNPDTGGLTSLGVLYAGY